MPSLPRRPESGVLPRLTTIDRTSVGNLTRIHYIDFSLMKGEKIRDQTKIGS